MNTTKDKKLKKQLRRQIEVENKAEEERLEEVKRKNLERKQQKEEKLI